MNETQTWRVVLAPGDRIALGDDVVQILAVSDDGFCCRGESDPEHPPDADMPCHYWREVECIGPGRWRTKLVESVAIVAKPRRKANPSPMRQRPLSGAAQDELFDDGGDRE